MAAASVEFPAMLWQRIISAILRLPSGLVFLLCASFFAETTTSLHAAELELHEVLRRHHRALGDLTVGRRVNSLEVRGTGMQQGHGFNFSLHKKAPNLLRYEIKHDQFEDIVAFDGRVGWKWRHRPEPGDLVLLSEDETRWLRMEAAFGSILNENNRAGWQIEFRGINVLEDMMRPVYHIRLHSLTGAKMVDVYLDMERFLEVRRSIQPEPNAVPLVTDYLDYRNVSGLMIPHRVVSRVAGNVVSRVDVDEVRLNRGMLNFYFQPPPGLVPDPS